MADSILAMMLDRTRPRILKNSAYLQQLLGPLFDEFLLSSQAIM